MTAASTTTISSVVTGGSGLAIAGSSAFTTLSLPAVNAITGNTSLNGGGLTLGSVASIGSGNLTITGTSTLTPTQGLTFTSSQAVTLNNATVTFAAGAPITFNGLTTLNGISQVTNNDSSGLYFDGQVIDGAIAGQLSFLTGTGTAFLTNANSGTTPNSFTGGVMIGATTVVVGDSSALGTSASPLAFNGATATLVAAGSSPLVFNQQVYVTATNTLTLAATSSSSSVTFGGNINLVAALTLVDNIVGATAGAANTTISGNIVDVGAAKALTFEGPGTLALTGTNTFAAGFTLGSLTAGNNGAAIGTVNINSSSSLGSGTLTLTSGVINATAGSTAGLTFGNLVSIGAGPLAFTGGTSNLNNLTFNNPLPTAIVLTATPSILVTNTTTFAGIVSGAFGLTLSGVPLVSGTVTIAPIATGNLVLTAPNTFNTGAVTVSGGTLTVNGAGVLGTSTAVTINQGGTLTLDNAASFNNVNRLATTAALTLNGGSLNFLGSSISGLAAAQTLFSVALASGNSTISSTQRSGTAALTITTLTRSLGATVNFVGNGTALTSAVGNQIIVGTTLATTRRSMAARPTFCHMPP